MNLTQLDAFLMKYTENELFYKKQFESKNNKITYHKFTKNLNLNIVNDDNLNTSKSPPPLFTDDFLTKNGSDIKIIKHYRYNPEFIHKHEFFQIIYVHSGTCIHYVNGEDLKLTKGDLFILSPNISHSLKVFDGTIVLSICICQNTFNDYFSEFLKSDNILSSFFLNALYTKKYENYIIFHIDKDENLKSLILKMLFEQFNNKKYSKKIISSLLLIFFQYLIQDHENNYQVSSITIKNNKTINEILVYIQKNYESLTLNDLADKFHFSNSYLSKQLKKCTGSNFSQIIKYIKLRKSCDLLKFTNMNIYQISTEVGYSSEEHFIRTFRKEFNMSPTQYRRTS